MTLRTHTVYDHRDYAVAPRFAAHVCHGVDVRTPRDQALLDGFVDRVYADFIDPEWRLAGWEELYDVPFPGPCQISGDEYGSVVLRVHVRKIIQGVLPATAALAARNAFAASVRNGGKP